MFEKYPQIAVAASVSVHLCIGVAGYGLGLFNSVESPARIMLERGESVMVMAVSAPESVKRESVRASRQDEQRKPNAPQETLCRKPVAPPIDPVEFGNPDLDAFSEVPECSDSIRERATRQIKRKRRDIEMPDVPAQFAELSKEPDSKPSPESSGSVGDLREKGVQSKCVITHCQKPEYPEASRKRGEEGTSIFTITVDKSGKLISIALSESSGYHRLDKAAMEALAVARFEPAVAGGKPIESSKPIIITFRLDEP